MGFKVVISSKAETEFNEASYHYSKISKKLLRSFIKDFKIQTAYLKSNPYQFQIRYSNIRLVLLKKFPYSLHYTIEGDLVVVLGFFHLSMSEERILGNQ